eukprot:g5671.t1
MNPESVEPWGDANSSRKASVPPGPMPTSMSKGVPAVSGGGGVPARLFVRAMTSLAPHYRDDHEALEDHLREEHAIFAASEAPSSSTGDLLNAEAEIASPTETTAGAGTRRAHLCCTGYQDGLSLKRALEAAAGGTSFVRTALNSNADAHGGDYCAVAHVSSAVAARTAADRVGVSCSPLTHASKEPLSLLAPSSEYRLSRGSAPPGSGDGGDVSHFGLRLGPSVQDGRHRGLVVTLSPGSLPLDTDAASEEGSNTRGGIGGNGKRSLSSSPSPSSTALERTWRAFWDSARGSEGAVELARTVPWTDSAPPPSGGGGSGDGRRSLLTVNGGGPGADSEGWNGSGDGSVSRARKFHGDKVTGYKAAVGHLGEKMASVEARGKGGQGAATLAETCGWDRNLVITHGRDDLLYLRGIHHAEHDEATSEACFIALVGFLSAQPEVMHIQPEARVEANNKVLTAYIEGGEPTETPMRSAGLTGAGEVIGVTDTGLDDNSCFFRDDVLGLVPRTSMANAESHPEYRKVIQYINFADGEDADGHGTHVAGIAAGKVYDGWQEAWDQQVSEDACEGAGLMRSCFGDCIEGTVADSCHWNPELSCPLSDCDEDMSCDDETGYAFPCFENPVDEIPAASGVASDAKLAFFDIGTDDDGLIIPNDIGDMWEAQYAAGARVMSNSWSLVTMTEPSARDVQLDEWVHDHPDTLVVFGAGNNGFEDGGFNPSSVQSPATGKTAMTVGVSNSGPGRAYAYYSDASSNYDGVLWPSEEEEFQVSPFSARGPVGRFTAKPDVVAPGLMVHSAKASLSVSGEETCALDSLGGTSMSAPAVAGAAALVRQYFSQGGLASYLRRAELCGDEKSSEGSRVYARAGLCEAFSPSGYLVKAVLINSAMWLGDMQTVSYGDKKQFMSVLDFAQGFGAVQLATSVPTDAAPAGAFFHDNELTSDDVYYYSMYVADPDKNLTVTVAWFDPPSTVSSYNLLHDLDLFVMSVDTQQYFRANHYATILAMCGEDEACVEKYEFTFQNDLADHMNPVERISISSSELEVGYYVVGVHARTLTESNTQAYGLAAAGGGLVLHDMSERWSDLGLETDSTEGGGGPVSESNPNGDLAGETPAPIGTAFGPIGSALGTSTPTAADSSSAATDIILAVTPAPVEGGESATSSSEEASSVDVPTSAGASSISSEPSGIGVSYVGGGDDDGGGGEMEDTDLTTGDNDGGGGFSFESKIATAASVAGALLLIGIGICLAVRRGKVRSARDDETGTFLCPPRHAPSSGRAVVADVEGPADIDGLQQGEEGRRGGGRHDSRDGEEEVGLYELPPITAGGASLPGYATAVASMPEEEGHTIIVGPSGVEQGVKLTAADESEVSDFYSAVDPGAVETLVSWGISRDFARVALRRTDNDVQDALRIIAEGNMDHLLALDHKLMAREGEEAARMAAAAYHGVEPDV